MNNKKQLLKWNYYDSLPGSWLIDGSCPCCRSDKLEESKSKFYDTFTARYDCTFCGYYNKRQNHYTSNSCTDTRGATILKKFYITRLNLGKRVIPEFFHELKKFDFDEGVLHIFKCDEDYVSDDDKKFLVAVIFGDDEIENQKYKLPYILKLVRFNWNDKIAQFYFGIGGKEEIEIKLDFEKTTELLNLLETLNKDFPTLEEISEKLKTEYK